MKTTYSKKVKFMYVHVLLTLDRAYGKLFKYETYVELLFSDEYDLIVDIAESFNVPFEDRIDHLYVDTYSAVCQEMIFENLEDEEFYNSLPDDSETTDLADYGDDEWS